MRHSAGRPIGSAEVMVQRRNRTGRLLYQLPGQDSHLNSFYKKLKICRSVQTGWAWEQTNFGLTRVKNVELFMVAFIQLLNWNGNTCSSLIKLLSWNKELTVIFNFTYDSSIWVRASFILESLVRCAEQDANWTFINNKVICECTKFTGGNAGVL